MSAFDPVGWANDETHALSQANMKVLDRGLLDVQGFVLTLAADAADVSIPGDIPGLDSLAGFRDLTVEVSAQSTATAADGRATFLRAQVNGITSEVYRQVRWRNRDDGPLRGTFELDNLAAFLIASSDTNEDLSHGVGTITFRRVDTDTPRLMILYNGGTLPGNFSNADEWEHQHGICRVNSAAASPLTSVRLFPTFGQFRAGSQFVVYGRGRST